MNDSQKEFLHILKDYIHNINGTYTLSPEILSYAKSQEVEGIIYTQTKASSLQLKLAASLYYAENRKHLVDEIDEKLSLIPHFFIKGLLLAKYYPIPGLRTMGDVDLVIKSEDVPKVRKILIENGFNVQPQVESVIVAFKGQFEFEIHTSLIHSGIGNEKAKEYFSNCWNFVNGNILDKNYHFIFLMQHLKGHIVSHGVGFRQFMDVAFFSKDTELDWNWISGELEKIDLLEFTKIVFSFIKRWFDIESPIGIKNIDNSFYEIATEKIFAGGVFGHEDEANRETGIVKHVIDTGESLERARSKYFRNQLFPGYQTMCGLPYCSYVKKTKILLPIAWIHRIFYRGFNKKYREGFVKRTTLNECMQERLDMMKKWGL